MARRNLRYPHLWVQQLFPPEIKKKAHFTSYPGHTLLKLADLSHKRQTTVDVAPYPLLLVHKTAKATKRERKNGNSRNFDFTQRFGAATRPHSGHVAAVGAYRARTNAR